VGLRLDLETSMIEEDIGLCMGMTTVVEQLSIEGVTPCHKVSGLHPLLEGL
jgi:hypothetical protein